MSAKVGFEKVLSLFFLVFIIKNLLLSCLIYIIFKTFDLQDANEKGFIELTYIIGGNIENLKNNHNGENFSYELWLEEALKANNK